jgi:hypothetical protein
MIKQILTTERQKKTSQINRIKYGIFHFWTKVVNSLAHKTTPVRVCNPDRNVEDFNSFQNISDGVANPVTLQKNATDSPLNRTKYELKNVFP